MTLEQLRSKLNIFRLSIKSKKKIYESEINCLIQVDGKYIQITEVEGMKTSTGKYIVVFKGE